MENTLKYFTSFLFINLKMCLYSRRKSVYFVPNLENKFGSFFDSSKEQKRILFMLFELNWTWNFVPQKPQKICIIIILDRCPIIKITFKEFKLAIIIVCVIFTNGIIIMDLLINHCISFLFYERLEKLSYQKHTVNYTMV